MCAYQLQAGNRCNEGEDEEHPPEFCRLFEKDNAHNSGAYRTNAGPYSIGRADGDGLYSFIQKDKAE